MVDETVKTIKDGSFYSWLIDGSSVSKNKLTYEAELLFIRTAPELVPRTSLFNFISMNDYGRVTSDHLFHAVLSNLARISGEGFFFFFCVPKAMLRRPVLFSPGNLLSVEGTPSVPKVSRLGPLDMARFLVSGCYVMGRTEECVQVFESLYHMDIHQCGQV